MMEEWAVQDGMHIQIKKGEDTGHRIAQNNHMLSFAKFTFQVLTLTPHHGLNKSLILPGQL